MQPPTLPGLIAYRRELIRRNRELAETWPEGRPISTYDARDYRRRDEFIATIDETISRVEAGHPMPAGLMLESPV